MARGPLSKSYVAAVALVVFSLVPYLALTAGVFPLIKAISASTGLSTHVLDVTISLSTGAYAMGTVVAVLFATHLRPRRMLVLYEAMFFLSSVMAAWSPTGGVFVGAFIVQGFCTSLMLIAAVPPLVTGWPAKKMPVTGAVMNLAIFGAVALGPTVGSAEMIAGEWRPLFWGVAGLALLALVFSLLSFEDVPPLEKSAPWDLLAVVLAVLGCGASFFGAGQLEATKLLEPSSLVPLVAGFALVVALVVYQYRLREPLMPVKAAATTVPVTGIYVALMASASGFGIMELVLETLKTSSTARDTALLFIPEFVAALAVAALFGVLFRTRYTPVLALAGLLTIVAAAALELAVAPSGGPVVGVVAGLLGLGVAASVSPALFMAGFSLRSAQLQRVFAMIELMRGVTAFLVAPILVYLVSVFGASAGGGAGGVDGSLWICLGIAAAGFAGGTLLYLGRKRRLEAPDLETWEQGESPAWESPRLRRRRSEHEPAAGAVASGDEGRAA